MSYELFNLNAPAVNEDASGHADIFKEERLADADLCICISSKTDSIAAIAGETTAKKQRLSQCAANKFPVHLVLLRKCPFFDSQAQRWQDSSSHGSGSRAPAAAAAAVEAAAAAAAWPV
ncbi:hypothetical protein OEZ86_009509 [Tetradesmus obliquus]|uniref:Uncharacterized protein n=1 Tax=Tetradesmus obliquus TaxID=3088 RepID=A0ABY8ULU6_TETOB|nr:hypothetical protein OEZ85_000956 [Tetradesmus obliquus]WIA42968.1 hypothetical protein OEZ86_009509 [Tetradesmus obliquus]